MKKCLHLKKTKRHWRRKPPKVVTWRERRDAERKAAAERRLMHPSSPAGLLAALSSGWIGDQPDIEVLAAALLRLR